MDLRDGSCATFLASRQVAEAGLVATLSPDEVLAAIEARMPREVAHLYHFVWADVVDLHFAWQSYNQLYGLDETVIILNNCASSFFASLQATLEDQVFLKVARLADPAESSSSGRHRRDNASFFKLAKAVREAGDEALADRLENAAATFKTKVDSISLVRNRSIAHRDLAVALRLESLPEVKRSDIENALDSVRTYMNIVDETYLGAVGGYEHCIEGGGADHLLFWLREGIAHQECKGH